MNGGYAPVTAAGLYGPGEAGAAYGVAVPSNVVALPGATVQEADGAEGSGASIAVPREFFRSSGFGLLLLIALVIYFDVRVLNK